jgi:lipid A disaccharide synthetase
MNKIACSAVNIVNIVKLFLIILEILMIQTPLDFIHIVKKILFSTFIIRKTFNIKYFKLINCICKY